MQNPYLEQIFYHYILDNNDLLQITEPEFFGSSELQEIFKISKDFKLAYKEAPTFEQMTNLIQANNKEDIITETVLLTLYRNKLKVKEYTDDWLSSNALSWARWTQFIHSVQNMIYDIKVMEPSITSENAKEYIERLKNQFVNKSIVRYDEEDGISFFDPLSHKADELECFSTGYSFVDMCANGGYWPGSLWVWAGAPKAGKSLVLQNLSAMAVKKGYNSAYVTFELAEKMVVHRLGSNLLNIPMSAYRETSEDTDKMRGILSKFRVDNIIPPGELYVKEFGTSTASVFDVEEDLLKQEEKLSTPDKPFKFKVVYLDYLNIMKNFRNPNSENTYMKIKQIAEDVRAMAQRNKWCVVSVTQLGRQAWDASDVVVSDIAESAALNATVDMMFGIIKDIQMNAAGTMEWKCLLTRVSPHINTKKKYNNDKKYMRITEDMLSTYVECTDIQFDRSDNRYVQKPSDADVQKFGSQFFDKPSERTNLQAHTSVGKELFTL